jgi:hypothetical protein
MLNSGCKTIRCVINQGVCLRCVGSVLWWYVKDSHTELFYTVATCESHVKRGRQLVNDNHAAQPFLTQPFLTNTLRKCRISADLPPEIYK